MTSPARAVIQASSSVGCCKCGLEVWRLAVNRKMSIGIVWVESHYVGGDRRGSWAIEEE